MSDQPEVLQIGSGTQPGSCCCAEEGGPPAARDNPQTIRTEVQNYYGEVAELQLTGRSQPDCCGSDFYEGEDLSLLPDTAVQSSRGCGNPHAIASLQPGEIVLDLGSGGGLDVLLAARQVGEDGYVYGVDMTDSMLELARGNAAKVGATKVEFRKGDLEDLPLNADSVDVIISNCVVNLTPDKGKALHEAFRVLKPWGRLAISDIVVDGDLSGLPVTEEQIRAGLSWAGCIAGALTVTELTNLLHDAGFEDIAITVVHRYSAADFLGDLPSALTDLQPPVLQDLLQRFTSSSIEARKPCQ
jgi:arsenite methyltransferase